MLNSPSPHQQHHSQHPASSRGGRAACCACVCSPCRSLHAQPTGGSTKGASLCVPLQSSEARGSPDDRRVVEISSMDLGEYRTYRFDNKPALRLQVDAAELRLRKKTPEHGDRSHSITRAVWSGIISHHLTSSHIIPHHLTSSHISRTSTRSRRRRGVTDASVGSNPTDNISDLNARAMATSSGIRSPCVAAVVDAGAAAAMGAD